MWELDYKESWVRKNWCFWTVILEKTLESPLDCKEIQPVHPKGNQSWLFIGRTDVEAETPILWPPDAKSWLIWKDPDAGKIEGRQWRGWQRIRWLDDITRMEQLIPLCSVQFSSVTQLCPTLCNPMNRSIPGLPVHHQLPESTQTHVHCVSDAIQPSHLCPLLLLLPSIFPSIRVFSSEWALCIRWPKDWSFSFRISPSQWIFRVDFL